MELSIFDLSKHLGVVPDTIERWVRQGKLPVFKKGTKYRFQSDELNNWASKHNINLKLPGKGAHEKQSEAIITLSTAVENGGVH